MLTYRSFGIANWALVALALCSCRISADSTSSDAKKVVDVDVHYESKCPDSINFITKQLAPTWTKLKDHLHITFIPYGKATHSRDSSTGQLHFSCQHGNAECEGNKAQACAIKELKNNGAGQETIVPFVNCVMGSKYPPTAVPQCLSNSGLTEARKARINHCSTGNEGDVLLLKNSFKTDPLMKAMHFVPAIVINGKYDQKNQGDSLKDFQKVVCRNISDKFKPSICS